MFKLKGIKPKPKYQFGGTVDLSQSPSNYYYMGESVMPVMPIQPFNPQTDSEATTPKAKSDKSEGLDLGDDKDLKDIKGLNKQTDLMWTAYQAKKAEIQRKYKEYGNAYLNRDFSKDLFEVNQMRGIMKNSLANNQKLVEDNQTKLNTANANYVINKGKILVQDPNNPEGVSEIELMRWWHTPADQRPQAVKGNLYSAQMHQAADNISDIIGGTDVSKKFEVNQQSIKDITEYVQSIGKSISTGDKVVIDKLGGNASPLVEFVTSTKTESGHNWKQYQDAMDAISLSQAQENGIADNLVSRLLQNNGVSFTHRYNKQVGGTFVPTPTEQISFTRDDKTNEITRTEITFDKEGKEKITKTPNISIQDYLTEAKNLYIEKMLNPYKTQISGYEQGVKENVAFSGGGSDNKQAYPMTEYQLVVSQVGTNTKATMNEKGIVKSNNMAQLNNPQYMSVSKVNGVPVLDNKTNTGITNITNDWDLANKSDLTNAKDESKLSKEDIIAFPYVNSGTPVDVDVKYYVTTQAGEVLDLETYVTRLGYKHRSQTYNTIAQNFETSNNSNNQAYADLATEYLENFRKEMASNPDVQKKGLVLMDDPKKPYIFKSHYNLSRNSIVAIPKDKLSKIDDSVLDVSYGLKNAETVAWANNLIQATMQKDEETYKDMRFFVTDLVSGPVHPANYYHDQTYSSKTEDVNTNIKLNWERVKNKTNNTYQDGGEIGLDSQTSTINTDNVLDNMPMYIKNNMAAYFGKNINQFI